MAFLQANLPVDVQVVRLSMPSNCPRHTCKGRCCAANLSQYQDCAGDCINGEAFAQAVVAKCANASYVPPFAADCLDWSYFCSRAFSPFDESVEHANCTDAPTCTVLKQRSYLSLLRLSGTVVMPGAPLVAHL